MSQDEEGRIGIFPSWIWVYRVVVIYGILTIAAADTSHPNPEFRGRSMTSLDWAIFAVYFVVIISFALYQSRKNEGVEGYFLGNRRMPWWAIGLSVMATQASAITFIGTTGQAFDDGMEFVQFYLALPFAMVVLCIVFVPFFYRARVFTAYEYLEQRFDGKTRALDRFSVPGVPGDGSRDHPLCSGHCPVRDPGVG